MRSRTKAVVLGALATMILVLGTAPLSSGAASPLGEVTTEATAGVTPGFANNGPRAITTGPDGLMWFTDFTSVNRINADGTVTSFDAEPLFGADPSLAAIVTGPDGNLWFTKFNPPGQVGKITPDGTMTVETSYVDGNVEDIIVGPDGNLWFSKPFNGVADGIIGRITTAGVVTEFTGPNTDPQPRDMAVGSDGNIWYSDDGNDTSQIMRATPTGVITIMAESGITPGFGAGLFALQVALGPDGNIWATLYDGANSAVARVTPAGAVTEFADTEIGLFSDIVSACGDLFLSQQSDLGDVPAIWRLTTAGEFTEYTAGLEGVSPAGLTFGPDEDLWITATGDPSKILTMGAGCAAVTPSSSTTATTANAVAPRFTG